MSEQDRPVVEAKPGGQRIGRLAKRPEELPGSFAAVTALVVAVGALVVSLRAELRPACPFRDAAGVRSVAAA